MRPYPPGSRNASASGGGNLIAAYFAYPTARVIPPLSQWGRVREGASNRPHRVDLSYSDPYPDSYADAYSDSDAHTLCPQHRGDKTCQAGWWFL